MIVPYKVHELIGARLKMEKRERQSAPEETPGDNCGFFKRLFRRVTAWGDAHRPLAQNLRRDGPLT
jgi:hypothetical protein